MRRDLPILVSKLAAIPGIVDIGLTTNGILLEEQAEALRDAGLRRLNISLDALDPVVFRKVTRRDGYERVLAGIEAARRAGFSPIKLNAVSVRGLTEDQIVPFGQLARETDTVVRFIEFMPRMPTASGSGTRCCSLTRSLNASNRSSVRCFQS